MIPGLSSSSKQRLSPPARTWQPGIVAVAFFFFSMLSFPSAASAQITVLQPPEQERPPAAASCGPGLKFYDSPFFKLCYPRRWHVIRGYNINYAWWVFSKRKHGERFEKPYIRVIIAKGLAESHLVTQTDSVLLEERSYTKATNLFKDVSGKKLNKRFWREISVGPEFDILAWYEQIKEKNLNLFNRALDSFWVPPPPRTRPSKTEQ
jgi:hypothetical protein